MVHDQKSGATILFGGIVWGRRSLLLNTADRFPRQTWELRNCRWTQLKTRRRPEGRHRGAMAYDSRLGFSLLFGGQSNSGGMLGDTWLFEDGQWRRQLRWIWSGPLERCGHAMAYDENTGAIVLFGGILWNDQPLGDTWVFENHDWHRVRGPGPAKRRYAAFAYDPDLGGCLLHGGSEDDAGRKQFGDTWLFRDRKWHQLPPDFVTDDRDDHGLAYHHATQQLIMLEGINGAPGVLARSPDGWASVPTRNDYPRIQCSPLVWDDSLKGLVMHGGEEHHQGPQSETTYVLRLPESDSPGRHQGLRT